LSGAEDVVSRFFLGPVRFVSIAVHPLERKKKIGRAMMDKVLDILKAGDATLVRLEVRRSNVEAQRFYETLGFKRSHVWRIIMALPNKKKPLLEEPSTNEDVDFSAELIKQINKEAGNKIAFNLGTDEAPTTVKRWISTGSKQLDYIISNRRGGGVAEGRIVEIQGPPSSGKSHIAYEIAKSTQKMNGIVVYIDTENATSVENLEGLGIDIRKRFVEEGLESALNERPRPGARPKLSEKAEKVAIAIACSSPPEGRSCWTMQMIADKLVQLKYVDDRCDDECARTDGNAREKVETDPESPEERAEARNPEDAKRDRKKHYQGLPEIWFE
jgi:hypothetical protein